MSLGASARQAGRAAGEWVAIIDDHASLRSCLSRALRLEGIRSETFASAEEFLECEAPTAPRCLLLDMNLPGMSGRQLAQYLARARPPVPPIIFISGHEDQLAAYDGCPAAHGRLRKPFEMEALLALVTPLVRPTAG